MLRPVDTQTVYQQTQEVASRQQMLQQAQTLQQDQFSDLLKKQVHEKQKKVNESQKGERVENDLNKNNKKQQKKQSQDKNKKESVPPLKKQMVGEVKHTSIDVRI